LKVLLAGIGFFWQLSGNSLLFDSNIKIGFGGGGHSWSAIQCFEFSFISILLALLLVLFF